MPSAQRGRDEPYYRGVNDGPVASAADRSLGQFAAFRCFCEGYQIKNRVYFGWGREGELLLLLLLSRGGVVVVEEE